MIESVLVRRDVVIAYHELRFNAPEVEAVLNTLALAAGEIGEAEYGAWLKANSGSF